MQALYNALIGMACVGWMITPPGLLLIAMQPLLMFLVMQLGSTKLVYALSLFFLRVMEMEGSPYQTLYDMAFPPRETPYAIHLTACKQTVYKLCNNVRTVKSILSVVLAKIWMTTKCLTFSLDTLKGDVPKTGSKLGDLVRAFGFCFYVPNSLRGPILTFDKYHDFVSDQITGSQSCEKVGSQLSI